MDKTQSDRRGAEERSPSLQGLRGVAFLGIFLTHVGMPFAWAGLSVSVFFVLSGYLLTQRHGRSVLPDTLRGQAAFAWRRIARIYPLHLITTALYALLRLIIESTVGLTGKVLAEVAGLMALNVTLLQSWVPHHLINVSLNGVAWFLSAMLFLYFVFPPLLRRLRRMGPAARTAIMLGIPVVQMLTCIPMVIHGVDFYVYSWYSYCFPLFRLGDFTAGCCLGLLMLDPPETARRKGAISPAYTVLELLTLGLTVGEMILRRRGSPSPAVRACFNNTSLYIYLALAWVYLAARRKGLLTRLLALPILVWVGDISPYAYLIHYLLTQYALQVRQLFDYHPQGWALAGIILVELTLSLLLSAVYRRFTRLRALLRADTGRAKASG